MIDTPTVQESADEYTAVLNGPANGWGAHIDPVTGIASEVMYRLGSTRYGKQEWNAAVDASFKNRRSS